MNSKSRSLSVGSYVLGFIITLLLGVALESIRDAVFAFTAPREAVFRLPKLTRLLVELPGPGYHRIIYPYACMALAIFTWAFFLHGMNKLTSALAWVLVYWILVAVAFTRPFWPALSSLDSLGEHHSTFGLAVTLGASFLILWGWFKMALKPKSMGGEASNPSPETPPPR